MEVDDDDDDDDDVDDGGIAGAERLGKAEKDVEDALVLYCSHWAKEVGMGSETGFLPNKGGLMPNIFSYCKRVSGHLRVR